MRDGGSPCNCAGGVGMNSGGGIKTGCGAPGATPIPGLPSATDASVAAKPLIAATTNMVVNMSGSNLMPTYPLPLARENIRLALSYINWALSEPTPNRPISGECLASFTGLPMAAPDPM